METTGTKTITFSEPLLTRLRHARCVAVLTGAGISAESGVPTFRGDDGIWKKLKPEELATFEAFQRNPELVWEWYNYRRRLMASVEPNDGHRALAQMEPYFEQFTIITQNIDNLHRRAGSQRVYELHGNIERNYCIVCGTYASDEERFQQEQVPHCRKCNGLVRPDIVWFGELLPAEEWEKSEQAARLADVFFVVGTSSVVYPAASLPVTAKRSGSYLVEINLEPTGLSAVADEVLLGSSGVILPALLNIIKTLTVRV